RSPNPAAGRKTSSGYEDIFTSLSPGAARSTMKPDRRQRQCRATRAARQAGPRGPGSTLFHMLAEEPEGAGPGVGGGGLVVDVRPGVVEETGVDPRIDVDLGLLAGFLDGRVGVLGHLRRHEAVLLCEEPEHRPRELRVVGLHVWMDAVEIDARRDRGVERGGVERELAAHAVAHGADLP